MSNSLFLKKWWLSNPILELCASITRQKCISHCLNTLRLNLMNQDGAINFNCCVKMWFWSRIWWAHRYLTTCGENGVFFLKKIKKIKTKQNCIFHTGVTRRKNPQRQSEKCGRESAFTTGNDSSIHISSLRLENKSMKTNHTFAHNTVCGKCGGGLNKSQSKYTSVAWVKMLPDWENHNILSALTAEEHRH